MLVEPIQTAKLTCIYFFKYELVKSGFEVGEHNIFLLPLKELFVNRKVQPQQKLGRHDKTHESNFDYA